MTNVVDNNANPYHVLLVIDAKMPNRAEQALRAAVGIAMSCRSLRVLITPVAWLGCSSPLGQRCIATLQSFGHAVRIVSLRDAAFLQRQPCRVEVWR